MSGDVLIFFIFHLITVTYDCVGQRRQRLCTADLVRQVPSRVSHCFVLLNNLMVTFCIFASLVIGSSSVKDTLIINVSLLSQHRALLIHTWQSLCVAFIKLFFFRWW